MAKAEAEARPEGPARGAAIQSSDQIDLRNDVWPHAITAIVISTLGILTAFVVVWWFTIARGGEQADEDAALRHLGVVVSVVDARHQELERTLKSITQSTAVRDALLASQSATPAALSFPQIESALPWVRRISVFARGGAVVELQAPVPVSYAALDLIQRAEAGAIAGPEVSLNNRELTYAAAPILVNGAVSGTLLLVVDTEWFSAPLAETGEGIGRLELVQSYQGAEPVSFLTWGNAGDAARQVEAAASIANWSVRLQPDATARTNRGATSLLGPVALCLSLVLGGVFLAFSRQIRLLNTDLRALLSWLTRLVRDGAAPSPNFGSRAIQALARQLAAVEPAGKSFRTEDTATSGALASRPAAARTAKAAKPASPVKVGARVSELLAENRDETTEEDFLEVSNQTATSTAGHGIGVEENPGPADFGIKLDPDIFRAYDIRGLAASTLSADIVYWIGRAFAAEAIAEEQQQVVVGRDGRQSSEELKDALINGLMDGGMEVTDIGTVPTPVLYYATHELGSATGIMITGSHNPPEYNGLKMVIGGITLADGQIQSLRRRIDANELPRGEGSVQTQSLLDRYVARICGDVAIADALKVVVDCGNGVGGLVAPRLIEELGCEVIPLYCDVDGRFPNHHPDPADPANLEDLVTVVQAEGADLGIAFDGDADRIGVVTNKGEIIWPDKLMMLFSQDIVGRNPGADIIYDVKCSRHLNTLISEYGGRPIMWKTGHSHMKAKLKETGALLAGEFSGHICFGERWYGFDDALYAAARLLEIVSSEGRSVADLFSQFPVTCQTPELKIKTTDTAKFAILEKLRTRADFGDGTITAIDGIRVDFADGWGLIRASNTGPVLSLRFEADGQAALQRIRNLFQEQLAAIDPSLRIS